MQSYPYKFSPQAASTSIMADANLFVYESGKAGVDGANTAVIVKPANGGEIVVKPGQRFRLSPGERAQSWAIRTQDAGVTLTANFVIGSGEFDDANTLNTFKLDATFANSVLVTNTADQRLPVTLDPAQRPVVVLDPAAPQKVTLESTTINNTTANRVPISLDASQVLNTSEGTVAYTKAWSMTTAANRYAATQILSAAENVNGVYIDVYTQYVSSNGGGGMSILAKATQPTSINDGDVLWYANLNVSQEMKMPKRILVPKGKALWIWTDALESSSGNMRYALFTFL